MEVRGKENVRNAKQKYHHRDIFPLRTDKRQNDLLEEAIEDLLKKYEKQEKKPKK